ncbi:camphor resistance protein CrcB [Frondihabitans sp. PhB188]|uniref:fluoride efflux transporter FluC n=1 Tax=Frondihabitans sp. PhB188 TaxID=2485200 RepID=UPI000F4A7F79|nr:CrcB family protein [Frondihabitans sp. PhB188]ROQ39920.1 camphor resistance protein CrcB [Frondihabitans sp. PhB188]
MIVFLLVCVAGGVGAALRFVVDGAVRQRLASTPLATFPVATQVINVTGSFGLGLLTGLGASSGLPHDWVLVLGGGLMGGYTTFSTASVEAVRLAGQRRFGAAVVYGVGTLVVATGAAALGVWMGGGF